MRLTVRFLGTEVFHISTDPEPNEDTGCSLDGGTTSSYPVGFTRRDDEHTDQRPEWWGDED